MSAYGAPDYDTNTVLRNAISQAMFFTGTNDKLTFIHGSNDDVCVEGSNQTVLAEGTKTLGILDFGQGLNVEAFLPGTTINVVDSTWDPGAHVTLLKGQHATQKAYTGQDIYGDPTWGTHVTITNPRALGGGKITEDFLYASHVVIR